MDTLPADPNLLVICTRGNIGCGVLCYIIYVKSVHLPLLAESSMAGGMFIIISLPGRLIDV